MNQTPRPVLTTSQFIAALYDEKVLNQCVVFDLRDRRYHTLVLEPPIYPYQFLDAGNYTIFGIHVRRIPQYLRGFVVTFDAPDEVFNEFNVYLNHPKDTKRTFVGVLTMETGNCEEYLSDYDWTDD